MISNTIVIRIATQGANTKLVSALFSSSSENEGSYPIYSPLFDYLNNSAYSELSAKVKMLLLLLSQFLIISIVVYSTINSISLILSFN